MWALVHLPLFFFLLQPCGASLGNKGRVRGYGGFDSPFCCYLPSNLQIICYPPPPHMAFLLAHSLWKQLVPIILNSCYQLVLMIWEREREQSLPTCVNLCVFYLPFHHWLSLSTFSPFLPSLLMLNYCSIYFLIPTSPLYLFPREPT